MKEVWSKLPEEIVGSIFSRLTVFDLLRAGSTCTSFRAFVSLHPSISSSSVSILLFAHPFNAQENAHDSSAWAYDCARDAWLKISLAFLRPNLPDLAYPVASAGGLLCFVGPDRDFFICNPISRSWRKLPSIPRTLFMDMENKTMFRIRFDERTMQAFGLICDSITGTYDFFVIHHPLFLSEKGSSFMHYSSSLSQWSDLLPFPMSVSYNLHNNTIISCNSRLYTLWDTRTSLLVFAYSDNIWTKIESPDCTSASHSTSSLLNAFLMDIHGSLHMVGAVGAIGRPDEVWEGLTSVHMWKLHAESNEWMEVTCMPSSILQEFRTHIDFDELQCWGKNGVMYMKSFRSDVLMFDLGKIEWKWLKETTVEADILWGLILEPSLSASV